jgi:hypothetical protein
MASCPFGLHISRWRSGCKENSEKCMVCHNTSNKPAHHTKDCPILKQLGFKLVKRTPADGNEAASRVGKSPAPTPAPPPSAPASSADGGSTGTPGAFTAATELDSYDSGEEFDYEGKYEGSVYTGKSNNNISGYLQASHVTAEPIVNVPQSGCRRTTSPLDPAGVRTVQLPKLVVSLLLNPPAHSTSFTPEKHTKLIVADTGATDHMLPTSVLSFRTDQSPHDASVWATTPSPPSWAMAPPSSPSMGNES